MARGGRQARATTDKLFFAAKTRTHTLGGNHGSSGAVDTLVRKPPAAGNTRENYDKVTVYPVSLITHVNEPVLVLYALNCGASPASKLVKDATSVV